MAARGFLCGFFVDDLEGPIYPWGMRKPEIAAIVFGWLLIVAILYKITAWIVG